jgi:hypothetical protein
MRTILVTTYVQRRMQIALNNLNDEQKSALKNGKDCIVNDEDETIRIVNARWSLAIFYKGTYGEWMGRSIQEVMPKKVHPQNEVALSYRDHRVTEV